MPTPTPELLKNFRELGRTAFEKLPWPDAKNDIYKRSDLSFLQNGFSFIPQKSTIQTSLTPNQTIFHHLSNLSGTSNQTAQQYLGSLVSSDRGKFESFNAAHTDDGLVVRIPENTRLDEPLTATWNCVTNLDHGCFFPRLLLVADKNSRSVYIEEWQSGPSHAGIVTSVAEIIVEDNAELIYIVNQNFNPQTRSLAFEHISLGKNAKLHLFHWEQGSAARHLQITSSAPKPGSEFTLTGAALAQHRQNFDARVIHAHQAIQTKCNMLWKTALKDRSRASLYGLLNIAAGADGSQAFQTINNLILSPHASSNPDPRLEILANDVIAKHASTAGYLDEEQLFYLNSRGIAETQAEGILTAGFLQETALRLESPWREKIANRIKESLHVE